MQDQFFSLDGADLIYNAYLAYSVNIKVFKISRRLQGPPYIFAPYIFCPANRNLNFLSLFGLAAIVTNPCGCVNWK